MEHVDLTTPWGAAQDIGVSGSAFRRRQILSTTSAMTLALSMLLIDAIMSDAAGQECAVQASGQVSATTACTVSGTSYSTSANATPVFQADSPAGSISVTSAPAITSGGTGSTGVSAIDGGTVTFLAGGSVTTTGTNALGLQASGNASTRITAAGLAVTSMGHAISVASGGQVQFSNGTINSMRDGVNINFTNGQVTIGNSTITAAGSGIFAAGSNAAVTITDTRISTTGTGAGLIAEGGTITSTGTTIVIAAANAAGLRATAGGVIGFDAGSITTIGTNSYGAHASAGGRIDIDPTTIITSATGAHGLFADGAGAIVTSSGDAIYTGVRVDASGQPVNGAGQPVTDPALYVSSGANTAHGAFAQGGGQVWLNVDPATGDATGDSGIIQTLGDGSDGLRADGTGSAIAAAGEAITTKGRFSNGAYALNGGAISITGGSISTTSTNGQGANAAGLRAEQNGMISAFGTAITTSGAGSHGVTASAGGTVNLGGDATHHTTINVLNTNNRGLQTESGTINAAFTDVTSAGHGALASGTGAIHFDGNSTVTATGASRVGLGAESDSLIDSTGPITVTMRPPDPVPPATTYAVAGTAVYMHDGGLVALGAGSTLNISGGAGGTGITIDNSDLAAPIDGLTINLNAATAPPPGATFQPSGSSGVVALNGGTASFEDLVVTGASAGSGVFARDAGSHVTVTGASEITIVRDSPNFYELRAGSTLFTAGNPFTSNGSSPAHGLSARDSALVTSTGTTITVAVNYGAGAYALRDGRVDLDDNAITTTATGTSGLHSVYGVITARNSTVDTSGGGTGVLLASDTIAPAAGAKSVVEIADTAVTATGDYTYAFYSRNLNGETPNEFRMSGGSLSSEKAVAIGAAGRVDIELSDGARVEGPYMLVAFGQDSFQQSGAAAARVETLVNLVAKGGSELVGDSVVTTGCVYDTFADRNCVATTHATANVLLDEATTLTGTFTTEPGNTANMVLDSGSTWNVTGNSNVTFLRNELSDILFTPLAAGADPEVLASYKTLTTIDYVGAGGLIGLNTYLGVDGSPSDRLVIDSGTATGATRLKITNSGGEGAITTGNGILVVDAIHGATTVPGGFALANLVIAGPYEYTLHHGSIDDSAPESWFLRNILDCP
ncbi:hypothetical protein, partial [Edaphosphingomonas haloaromaticamans]|uniref:hypothetical protein n=1 Tax=Edaphosphingomonas haloaromaticamans TaxID=653954 RepID=UPI00174D2029